MLKIDEKISKLGKNYSIIVSKRHTFGTDAVLLASFAKPSIKQIACDLGTGCGIIPMLWQVWSCGKEITAVEIQNDAYDMLKRTISMHSLEQIIKPVCADLRQLKGIVQNGIFDVITCNPPYKKAGSGALNPDEGQRLARHEITCTVYDAAESAKKLLKFGGKFCMCNRPDRLFDTMDAMIRSGIEPKELRMVQQRTETKPWLFLIKGKKGAKPGLIIEPVLIEENEKGEYTPEMKYIYGEFGE